MAQRADRLKRFAQRTSSGRRDGEIELPFTATLGRRLALARLDEPLLLQPVEARVDTAGRGLAAGAGLDVVLDRHPVGVGVECDDGEQQKLLQSDQSLAPRL